MPPYPANRPDPRDSRRTDYVRLENRELVRRKRTQSAALSRCRRADGGRENLRRGRQRLAPRTGNGRANLPTARTKCCPPGVAGDSALTARALLEFARVDRSVAGENRPGDSPFV